MNKQTLEMAQKAIMVVSLVTSAASMIIGNKLTDIKLEELVDKKFN